MYRSRVCEECRIVRLFPSCQLFQLPSNNACSTWKDVNSIQHALMGEIYGAVISMNSMRKMGFRWLKKLLRTWVFIANYRMSLKIHQSRKPRVLRRSNSLVRGGGWLAFPADEASRPPTADAAALRSIRLCGKFSTKMNLDSTSFHTEYMGSM